MKDILTYSFIFVFLGWNLHVSKTTSYSPVWTCWPHYSQKFSCFNHQTSFNSKCSVSYMLLRTAVGFVQANVYVPSIHRKKNFGYSKCVLVSIYIVYIIIEEEIRFLFLKWWNTFIVIKISRAYQNITVKKFEINLHVWTVYIDTLTWLQIL